MDEGKLRRAADRGTRAEALLKNELLQEAWAAIETALVAAWRESGPDDVVRREQAHMALKLLDKQKLHFEKIVRDGAHSQKELERELLRTKPSTLAQKVIGR